MSPDPLPLVLSVWQGCHNPTQPHAWRFGHKMSLGHCSQHVALVGSPEPSSGPAAVIFWEPLPVPSTEVRARYGWTLCLPSPLPLQG